MTGLDWTDHSLINSLALPIIMIELAHLTPSVTEWENARKLILHHPNTPSPGIKDVVFLNLLLGAFTFYARTKNLIGKGLGSRQMCVNLGCRKIEAYDSPLCRKIKIVVNTSAWKKGVHVPIAPSLDGAWKCWFLCTVLSPGRRAMELGEWEASGKAQGEAEEMVHRAKLLSPKHEDLGLDP